MEREEIHILDSRTTCLSLGLLVEIAAQRAKEGKTAAEIMTELEGLTSRVRICAGIETLEYLKKGGRLSGTAAALGTMLNIRPLMGILDGKVLMLGKARGNKKMYAQLKQMVEEEGIDDDYPVLLGHAQSMENYEKFKEACGDLIAGRTQLYGDIGCVVGAFLILMVDPVKALIFVIVFLVLQQIEGNLIYPKVVGKLCGASIDLGAGSSDDRRQSDGNCRNADLYSDCLCGLYAVQSQRV